MYLASVITAMLATAHVAVGSAIPEGTLKPVQDQEGGFTIPEGQPNGRYMVYIRDDGTEHHERLGDIDTSAPAVEHKRTEDITNTTMGVYDPNLYSTKCMPEEGSGELDHKSCDMANRNIDDLCSGGFDIENGKYYYFVFDCVVAYFCHLKTKSSRTVTCSPEERGATSLFITDKCGRYKPGLSTRAMSDINTGDLWKWSYGRENWCTDQGKKFCGGSSHSGL
ncbi:hypothetical protein GE09DRAFT_493808 [Coniochaeta sp. 2T2.1]|nr:hypothetical protein GE09DRAFT_493808 [Coniochaeta sp. 2T2.1]